MDALKESYFGGILVGVIGTLVLQMLWRLIKEIVQDIDRSQTRHIHSKTFQDKIKSA